MLVTHDRFLLDRVSTAILALDGRGGAETFADYAQWEAARGDAAPAPRQAGRAARPQRGARRAPKRLSYHEQREWDGMEAAILDAEARSRRPSARPTIRRSPPTPPRSSSGYAELEAARAEVDRLYARWAELEAKQA